LRGSRNCRRQALFLLSVSLFPTLQLMPHVSFGLYALHHGATPLATAFVMVALGADLLFSWLLLAFARAKFGALRGDKSLSQRETTMANSSLTVLIPVCDEALNIIDRTFWAAKRIRHRPLQVLVVENSRDPEHRAEVVQRARYHGLDILAVRNRGTKAAALNDALPYAANPYVAVLDADVVASPDFAEVLLPHLAGDPLVAFVQGPQTDRNSTQSYVAAAGGFQQSYFYEFVAEGFAARERALCVGSNCVFRAEAVEAVGGWPEDTVSEDVAISWQLHRAGYRSRYVRADIGQGLAPVTLGAFIRQRSRHAQGAFELIRRVFNDRGAQLGLRLHYLLLASFPMVAVAYPLFAIQVILTGYILDPYWAGLHFQIAALGAMGATQTALLIGMGKRGYRVVELLAGQGGTLLAIPAYLVGAIRAMTTRSKRFQVTPKQGPEKKALRRHGVAISLIAIGALIALFAWSIYSWQSELGIAVFGVWLAIHGGALVAPLLVADGRTSHTTNSHKRHATTERGQEPDQSIDTERTALGDLMRSLLPKKPLKATQPPLGGTLRSVRWPRVLAGRS
jgi:cellulose synthase/poly-beta-1,6-N-acetylglucosamine synthase-like glycosyltransferase